MRRAFFFIVALLSATSSFASLPRASMLDRASEHAPAAADPLPETRVWASDVLAPFERGAESELTRALHQAYADLSTTNASGLGRFLSVDPGKDWDMHQPQSWNMYAYARNNPLKYVDPDGQAVRTTVTPTPGGPRIDMVLTVEISGRGGTVPRAAQVRNWITTTERVFAAQGSSLSTSLRIDAVFSPNGSTDSSRHQVIVDPGVTREYANQLGGTRFM